MHPDATPSPTDETMYRRPPPACWDSVKARTLCLFLCSNNPSQGCKVYFLQRVCVCVAVSHDSVSEAHISQQRRRDAGHCHPPEAPVLYSSCTRGCSFCTCCPLKFWRGTATCVLKHEECVQKNKKNMHKCEQKAADTGL